MKVAVVIPTLSNFNGLADVLVDLNVPADWNYRPFIIPNWRHGWSVAKSWNYGIVEAFAWQADAIVIANDDAIPGRDTVRLLVEALDRYWLVTGTDYADRLAGAHEVYDLTPSEGFAENLDFAFFAMRSDLATTDGIGFFDEGYESAYFEDCDYWQRLKRSGLPFARLEHAPFFHFRSTTGRQVPPEVVAANQRRYQEAWA